MRMRFPRAWPDSPDKYLYHYTKAVTALTKILPDRTLRAGPFIDMNDPREAKMWSFTSCEIMSDDPEDQNYCNLKNQRIREDALEATVLAQQSTSVLCFSKDDEARKPTLNGERPLGRGFSHSAMWAHYAGSHSGVCLIFDKTRLAAAIDEWTKGKGSKLLSTGWMFSGDVEYQDRESEFTFLHGMPHTFDPGDRSLRMETLSHVGRFHRELFFQKSLDWAYEKEYRYIFWSDGSEPFYIPFGDALAGIVVGENFGEHPDLGGLAKASFVRVLDNLCRELCIQQYMLWWCNGIPYLACRSRK